MNTKLTIHFLINLKSGGSKSLSIYKKLLEESKNYPGIIRVESIDFQNLAQQLKNALVANTLVIGGGDGTISRLIPLIKNHPRVGFLPLGTGNDLGRELRLADSLGNYNPKQILNFFNNANTCVFNLGRIQYGENYEKETYFINYVSFGFDANIIKNFDTLRKAKTFNLIKSVWINRILYGICVILNLNYFIPNVVTITNSNSNEKYFIKKSKSIIFANIRSIMGLGYSNLDSSPLDKIIECIIPYGILGYFSMLIHHKIKSLRPSFLDRAQIWNIYEMPNNVLVQIDGEPRPEIVSNQFQISTNGTINLITSNQASIL